MRRLPLRSPPRMRGKEIPAARQAADQGITPAYAGKRTPALRTRRPARDHPRVCGEKGQRRSSWWITAGSPPRVRGKAAGGSALAHVPGITPTCAGKSKPRRHGSPSAGDHPRVCGEKPRIFFMSIRSAGSPPRVRGKADAKSSGRYSRPLHGTPVSLDALR